VRRDLPDALNASGNSTIIDSADGSSEISDGDEMDANISDY
jgi:hypothetical protein